MDQMTERIKEVFSDEAYVQKLLAFETPEEVQASLEEKGIDVSVEELKQVSILLTKYSEGELSEEELMDVAGGATAPAFNFFNIINTNPLINNKEILNLFLKIDTTKLKKNLW